MTIPYDEAKVMAEQIIKIIEKEVYKAQLEILDRSATMKVAVSVRSLARGAR